MWLLSLIALVNLMGLPPQPERAPLILGASLTTAAVAIVLARSRPLDRSWQSIATIGLVFVLIGVSTWSAGERAGLTGPGFVLAFAWLGLHHSLRTVLLSAPFAAAVYVAAMLGAGGPRDEIPAGIPLILISTLVGVILSRTVGELRAAKRTIGAQERWRAAMTATLAHDVRSPLTSVTGVLELLADDDETPDRHRSLLAAGLRQANRIRRLATGLLDIERIEQGRLRLDLQDVSLAELAAEVAQEQTSGVVRVDVAPTLLVRADRERLEQILVNLVTNAVRHGAPPVVVDATRVGTTAEISVSDHGPGVPEADVPHIFDRLSSTNPSFGSVGLGLWIVRLLAEAHGGSAEYDEHAPGARFVVRLPAQTATGLLLPTEPAESSPRYDAKS